MDVVFAMMCLGLLGLMCAVMYRAVASRLVVLPDVFYLLQRRHALMLPLYNEPGVELETLSKRHVKLRLARPLPAQITVRTRPSRHGEHFMCEVRCETSEPLYEGISVHGRALQDVPEHEPPDEFDALAMSGLSALYLRYAPRGQAPREIATTWDVLCDLLGGSRISTWTAFTPHSDHNEGVVLQGPLQASLPGACMMRSPYVQAKLVDVRGRGNALTLTYVGLVRADLGAGARARDAMTRVLAHYHMQGVALANWRASSPRQLAIAALEDPQRAPYVRQLAARLLLDFHDTSSAVDAVAWRERMERAVWSHWRDHDLDELLPRMRVDALDACATPLLIEFAGVWTCARLRDAIKARASKVELITNGRIHLNMRKDTLIASMHLKRAFLRDGEAIVAGIEASEVDWVTEVFVTCGWRELWAQTWLVHRYEAWFEVVDVHTHLHMHKLVERGLDEHAAARCAMQLFDEIYAGWLETKKHERLVLIPLPVLLRVVSRRANFKDDAQAWSHLFETFDGEHMSQLFVHPELKESQRLELLARLVRAMKTRHIIARDEALYLELLGVFEISSAASAAVSDEAFDDVARALIGVKHEVFESAAGQRRLRYGVRAYVRQVERQGIRKGALETMHMIAGWLPSRHERWVLPVIARWTEAMGSDTMTGALSYSDEDARHGGLSLEDSEG